MAASDLEHYGIAGSKDGEAVALPHDGNSVALTAGIIVADVVGAGILSMAVAIAQFGWLLGTIVTIVLLSMNVHISIIVWRVRMKCPGARTYCELAEGAFVGAPPEQRRFAVLFTGITQQTLILGFLGVYTLSLGKAFGMIFYNVHLCLPTWTLIGCLFTLPFVASARRLGAWKSLIWVNCASILATVIIPLIVMAMQGVEQSRIPGSEVYPVAQINLNNVMLGVNIMLFSFTSQFMIVEIMAEMKDVADFPKAYTFMSAPFQGLAFLICGLGGYYFRGDLVSGIIVDSIPFGGWFQAAAVCLIVHMLITWVFKGIVFCRAMQTAWDPKSAEDGSKEGWMQWGALVASVMAFSYLIAQIVPFFVDLIDLLGATLTPIVCFMMPVVFYARWLRDFGQEEDRVGYIELAVIALEMVVAFTTLFVGTYFAVNNIIESWRTYGYPFACHCQGLWNTCECSGSHPGMEQCKAPALFNAYHLEQ